MDNKQLLNEGLGLIIKTLTETKQFVVEQAPDVVRQLLVWSKWEAIAGISLGVVLIMISTTLAYNLQKRNINWESGIGFTSSMVCGIALLGGLILVLVNSCNLLQIFLAPKLFVIQQLSGMM